MNNPQGNPAAKCIGLPFSIFYPETNCGYVEAQLICAECLIRDACLEWALVHREDHGIWGGVTERGRARMRKQRAAAR
jgi:WhiB family redox-sensing transcriptional regulator